MRKFQVNLGGLDRATTPDELGLIRIKDEMARRQSLKHKDQNCGTKWL